jgi:hypothetical protein
MDKVILILSCFLLAASLGSCTFPGPVFVMIVWDNVTPTPDAAFVHNIPGVPALIANIENGRYYPTSPGTYVLQYSYVAAPSGPFALNFTLSPNNALLGVEPAYYDLRIWRVTNPTLKKIPSKT